MIGSLRAFRAAAREIAREATGREKVSMLMDIAGLAVTVPGAVALFATGNIKLGAGFVGLAAYFGRELITSARAVQNRARKSSASPIYCPS